MIDTSCGLFPHGRAGAHTRRIVYQIFQRLTTRRGAGEGIAFRGKTPKVSIFPERLAIPVSARIYKYSL